MNEFAEAVAAFADAVERLDFEAASLIAWTVLPEDRTEHHARRLAERWSAGDEEGARRAGVMAAVADWRARLA